jgi:asparagine synthase (glutamine-hydrolysing)
MTHSLEVRCPLLDQELSDLVAPMPSAWKARLRSRKRLLRAAFAQDIPAEVMNRPKSGFGVPIAKWLRGDLGRMARELLCSQETASRRYLRPAAVASLLDEHRQGTHDHAYPLWNLLVFELWLRRFVERTA